MTFRPFFNAVNTLALVAGLALLLVGLHPFLRSFESAHWPFVEGEVVSAHVTSPPSANSENPAGGWGWRVDVRYRYRLGGEPEQTGSRIELGLGARRYLLRDFALRVVERYPPGKMVRVYYNPKNPGETVLERSPSMGVSLFWIVGGLSLMGLGIFVNFKDRWD
ncbi:MAG: DUF3592 domain-containing protein [Magnetococcales bacterium]|nr:DUF3592 domain-containing protein [Magnetococcales bacterium]